MSSDLDRVNALIRKALSTTSVEEARTCAFTAVEIMSRRGLVVRDPSEDPAPVIKIVYRPAPVKRRPPTAPSRTSFATECSMCHKDLAVGAQVFWSSMLGVTVCAQCFEDHLAGIPSY